MRERAALVAGVAVVAALLFLVVSCADTEPGPAKTPVEKGAVSPAEASVKGPGKFVADYQSADGFFTLMAGMKKGASPHGTVQIWYSGNIKEIIGNPSFMVPEGTVAIKPFDKDGEPGIDGIAIMIKKEKGYDPDNNDWHYEMRGADGKLMPKPEPGKIGMCINCHAAAKAKDYLAGTEMR